VDTGTDRWVFPTSEVAGQFLGYPVKRWAPSVSKAGHMAAVNRVRLAACPGIDGWTSERDVLHGVGFRDRDERLRVPDGIVEAADGRRFLVEVELSAKSPAAAREMVSGWPRACTRWGSDGVWLVCGGDAIRAGVRRAVEAVMEEYDGGVGRDLKQMMIRDTDLRNVEEDVTWLR
jgi:hypothetical protein